MTLVKCAIHGYGFLGNFLKLNTLNRFADLIIQEITCDGGQMRKRADSSNSQICEYRYNDGPIICKKTLIFSQWKLEMLKLLSE